MNNNVLLEKEEKIGIIKLNRPKALNALNKALLEDLDEILDSVEKDAEIEVVIITGEGKAFVAGADILEMKELNFEEARKFGNMGQAVFRRIEKMEKPTIAAINGFALGGGCELAMCCDMRIASEKAKFGQPEVSLGIIPGFSGTQRLPRLIGSSKAKELILTGDIINVQEAEQLCLVNKIVKPEDLMDESKKLAKKIIKNAPLAVRYANNAIKRGIETDIETGINIESELFGMCFASIDQKEGMTAFVEKRKADFKGK